MAFPQHGYSLSLGELDYLRLPLKPTLSFLQPLPVSLVRLSCPWPQIQPHPNQYNFKPLTQLLNHFHQHRHQVVLVVGVKSFRWPEFHFPAWVLHPDPHHPQTQTHILNFVRLCLRRFASHPAVSYLQIENEPLDPSGPDGLTLPLDFLAQEVALARQLTSHPIVLTVWGNQLVSRRHHHRLLPLADILGADLYFAAYQNTLSPIPLYSGPQPGTFRLLGSLDKPLWITELQAEPWEKDLTAHLQTKTRGFSPFKLEKFYRRCLQLNPQAILFWGAEYWAYHALQHQPVYLDLITSLISEPAQPA